MAKPRLRLNAQKAKAEYRKAINQAANQLIEEFYNEIQSKMATSEGRSDLERMSRSEESIIRRMIIGHADAIIDSYGTGSKADTHHSKFYDAYTKSPNYNIARRDKGKYIRGRPAGEYINLWGETMVSTGRREGQKLEPYYEPVSPSYAFQRAEIWVIEGNRINEVLSQHIARWVNGLYRCFEYT